MNTASEDLAELRNLGAHLLRARLDRGLSQGALARRCHLAQSQVSWFESGRRRPSLEQFVRIARALDLPLQRLMSGSDRPGVGLADLALELRRLGAVDLWVADATVPGAARRPEEVIASAVAGRSPDPRVVEAIPALLSWNELNPPILRAFGAATRTAYRLAWLADVALTIERRKGFPGGCRRGPLERLLKSIGLPRAGAAWDDLGKPVEGTPSSPVWRRWRIRYGATVDDFDRRAKSLASLGGPAEVPSTAVRGRARAILDERGRSPLATEATPPRRAKAVARRRKETGGEQADGR
ncbi:MAG TPA: helix-turn-helix transcriptional regulator [Isosphaeraceae bacterium]|nr:helix-turn-helix transcriptional regulator [Isosphaeraceae bacterium]